MKNNYQFFEYKRKRRKHYEMRIENEESEFPLYLRKTMNILRSINPLKLEYKNIFSIISPYLVIKDFPSSYKFKNYFTDEEIKLVSKFINDESSNTNEVI